MRGKAEEERQKQCERKGWLQRDGECILMNWLASTREWEITERKCEEKEMEIRRKEDKALHARWLGLESY